MKDKEVTDDAVRTIAECVLMLQAMGRQDQDITGVAHYGSHHARIIQNVLMLLQQNGPLLPQVEEDWRQLLVHIHGLDKKNVCIFLVESITLGLKLYQHTEIGISLLTPNEEPSNDQDSGTQTNDQG